MQISEQDQAGRFCSAKADRESLVVIFFEVRCHRAKAGISKRDRSINRAGMPSHTLDYKNRDL